MLNKADCYSLLFPLYVIFVYFYLLFDWSCNEVPCGPISYIWIFSQEFSFIFIDKMDKEAKNSFFHTNQKMPA